MVASTIYIEYLLSIVASLLILVLCLRFLVGFDRVLAIASNTGQGRFEAVDGLRGYLALCVFFYHVYVAFIWGRGESWNYPDSKFISFLGIAPVSIFFIITGYLFADKIIFSKKATYWYGLYIGRLFRIYPLYLFVLLGVVVVSFFLSSDPSFSLNDLYSLFYWLVFSIDSSRGDFFGYIDSWVVIAGVQWTLRYEWLFYFSLPMLYFLHSLNARFFFVVVLFGLLVGAAGITVAGISFFYTSLFLVGILAASISLQYIQRVCALLSRRYGSEILMLISILMTAGCYLGDILVGVQFGLFLLFIALRGGAGLFGVLRWKGSVLLGEISYSIYLTHGIVIFLIYTILDLDAWVGSYFILVPLATVLVVISSLCSYIVIEKRFIDIGYRFRRKLQR